MNNFRFSLLVLVLILVLGSPSRAQDPDIVSMQNGQVTFTNLSTQLEYRVEWKSQYGSTNGFSNIYSSAEYITATGTTAMTVDVPQYFRIAGTNALSNGIYRASDLPTVINAGTNAKFDIEWSVSPNGPWNTNYATGQFLNNTGSVVTIQSPRYFRISFVNCPSNFAGCGTWSDQTPGASNRTVSFPVAGNNYDPKCLKVKVGQNVTFSGTFASHPLTADCQEHAAMTNQASGGSAIFQFIKPGYYGYHCAFHGDSAGNGMAGNIWVIP